MPRLVLACLLTGVLSLLPALLGAQPSPDTIAGVVLDPSRAALPRATVRLLTPAGVELARMLTDDQGGFRFKVSAGVQYTVEASLVGFQSKRTTAAPGARVELVLPLEPVREHVVVTATRTETPTSQLGGSVTVISDSDIKGRPVLSLAELLRPVPGVAVVQTGGRGGVTSLFLRGGDSDYTRVLLDGIPLNEPGGFFDFSNLSVENLERVEIVRGSQSVLYGTDAMTGVIQLFTRRGQGETRQPHLSFTSDGGKYHTWHTQAALSGKIGGLDYSADWGRFSTDNQDRNGFFHDTTISADLGYALGQRTKFRLILRGQLSRAGTPGQTAFGRPDLDSIFWRRDNYAGLSLSNQTTPFWDQRLTYTYSRSHQVSRDPGLDPPFTPTFDGHTAPFEFFDFPFDFINDPRRHHLSYQSNFTASPLGSRLGRHTFTFVFEWDRELGSIGDLLSGEPLTRAQRDDFRGMFQDQMVWGPASLTYGVLTEDNQSFGRTVVPRASIAYLVRTGGGMLGATKLDFNFGLGVKEPSFLESFSPVAFFQGNPSLAPERSRDIDAGIEQRFWRDRAKLALTWFDNRFRDQIAFEITNFNTFAGSFFNIGRAAAKGTEVVVELAPSARFRATGSYTYLDSEITRSSSPFDPAFQPGRPLLRRPRHSGSLEVFWIWRRLALSSAATFVGRRADSDFADLQPPILFNDGYQKWDLAGSYRFPRHLTYFATFENLLNQDYMEALGFPALKFTYRTGIRIKF